MKTSKIILISLLFFWGLFLLSFAIIGVIYKKEGKENRIVSARYPDKTIKIDKPFKHIVVKNDIFYVAKKNKELNAKRRLVAGNAKNIVADGFSLWNKTRIKNTKNKKLPKSFYGEWYQSNGNHEYNGMIIHPDFMEHNYQACTYENIKKVDSIYIITLKYHKNTTVHYKIQQTAKDTLTVVLPWGEIAVFNKVDTAPNGMRVQLNDLPVQLRKKWYTTDGKNALEFDFTGNNLIFKDTEYKIEDIVFFHQSWGPKYRIIAKNSAGKTMMFYFKKWTNKYCQVGYFGNNGNMYKNKLSYLNRLSYTVRYSKTYSYVSISQGKIRNSYYNTLSKDPLNHPEITVKNDTLYLITNDYLGILLGLPDTDVLSLNANNCVIRTLITKLSKLDISLINSKLDIDGTYNFKMKIDTIRLNVNHSVIKKDTMDFNAILIKGIIRNQSDVTISKPEHLQLDVDKTSKLTLR